MPILREINDEVVMMLVVDDVMTEVYNFNALLLDMIPKSMQLRSILACRSRTAPIVTSMSYTICYANATGFTEMHASSKGAPSRLWEVLAA
jgi:hypothetical protein